MISDGTIEDGPRGSGPRMIFDKATFNSVQEVREAVVQAGLKRIRPCLMTISTTVFGLMPIFWATGRGSDVMQPMAISVGGMSVSVLVTIFIAPCLFCAVEEWKWKRHKAQNNHMGTSSGNLVKSSG